MDIWLETDAKIAALQATGDPAKVRVNLHINGGVPVTFDIASESAGALRVGQRLYVYLSTIDLKPTLKNL